MGIQINGSNDTIQADDGSLSLAGSVSYEDVTNVTSVGLSTFSSGIHIDDSITHLGDTNTKIRFPAVDTFTVETTGTERLRIDSSGVATFAGSITSQNTILSNRTGSTQTAFQATLSGVTKVNITAGGAATFAGDVTIADKIIHSGDTNTAIRFPAADTVSAETSGSERLRIDSSGNVIIGTTTAATNAEVTVRAASPQLSLYATPGNTSRVTLGDTDDYDIGQIGYDNSDNSMFFATNAATRMSIDSSGRMGLGTASPNAQLHVVEDGDFSVITASSNVTTTGLASRFTLGNSVGFARFTINMKGGGGEEAYLGSEGNFPIYFQTNGAERARIDSSGRLLVGSSSASNNLGVLVVQGYAGVTAGEGTLDLVRGNNVTGAAQGLGSINFGHSQYQGASIDAVSEGAWTESSSHPAYLSFSTSASGSSTPTERMRITHDGRLNVGGNFTQSTFPIQFTGTTDVLCIKGSGNNAFIRFQDVDSTADFTFGSDDGPASGSFIIYDRNANAYRWVIDSSGRMGINTTSPSRTLTVNGDINLGSNNKIESSSSSGSLQVQGGSTYPGGNILLGGGNGTDDIRFRTSGASATSTERMRIDSSGAVTVKRASTHTTGLQHGLAIQQGVATNGNRAGLVFKSLDGFSVAGINGVISTHSGTQINNVGYLEFYTKSSGAASAEERMRLDNSGRLFLFSSSSATAYIQNSAAASTSNYLVIGRYGSTNIDSGSTAIQVFTNGNVQNINNSYGALSDIKLKENIVDANSQWEDIKQVQVRNYNLIEGETHTQIGVVAQEIETVSPGLVYESPDRDEDGNDLGTVTKSVNYSVLYMKAVKALQEAIAKIETLEAKVAALEAG